MRKFFIFVVLLESAFTIFEPETHKNWVLLPHNKCGQVIHRRIVGGEGAPMNGYPWLVRLGYSVRKLPNITFLCGGALVNADTVLTAAHCVTSRRSKIKVVRLGEHNTFTDPDCDDLHCADPVIDVNVSKVVVHENYDALTNENDVAIVQLSEKVNFSASIKPICIGGTNFSKKNFVKRYGEVAGWGVYEVENRKMHNILQTVRVPVINTTVCNDTFANLSAKQICAGGQLGKDSCSGDSGGPLMILDSGPRYYILGIVSFGPTNCGETTIPGVYSNMSAYLKWFLDRLQ